MSSIFSFPRHRFYACRNCQRLVASDAEVCPHCDMDLGPESQVGAGASPFVRWNRTDDVAGAANKRSVVRRRFLAFAVGIVFLLTLAISKIIFVEVGERNEAAPVTQAYSDRNSPGINGSPDEDGPSAARHDSKAVDLAVAVPDEGTVESKAIHIDASLPVSESTSTVHTRDAEVALARSCANVGAWACVREHASKALALDAQHAESQSLLEQAIMRTGWRASTPATAQSRQIPTINGMTREGTDSKTQDSRPR